MCNFDVKFFIKQAGSCVAPTYRVAGPDAALGEVIIDTKHLSGASEEIVHAYISGVIDMFDILSCPIPDEINQALDKLKRNV